MVAKGSRASPIMRCRAWMSSGVVTVFSEYGIAILETYQLQRLLSQ
jgi:hypothetical protein